MDSVEQRRYEGKSGVGVLDKAVAVLSALAGRGPTSLAGVVEGTGLSRPTAYRILSALEVHGLVARKDGRYFLGPRLLGWGVGAVGADLVAVSRPVLGDLRDQTGESAQLYVREGDHRVCVATVERATGLKTTVEVGAPMPLEKGSAGKVLLAWSEDRGRFGVSGGRLEEIRTRGWAESVAEREEGVASVSAPVFQGERIVAAVGVSGPIARLGEEPGARLAGPVVGAARRIGALAPLAGSRG